MPDELGLISMAEMMEQYGDFKKKYHFVPEFMHPDGNWKVEKDDPDDTFTSIGGPVCVVGGEECNEPDSYIVGLGSDWGAHGPDRTRYHADMISASPNLLFAAAVARHVIQKARLKDDLATDALRLLDEAIAKATANPAPVLGGVFVDGPAE